MTWNNKNQAGKSIQQRTHLWAMIGILTLLFAACNSPAEATEIVPDQTTPTTVVSTPVTPTKGISTKVVPGDWPTYLSDNGRSGFNKAETTITLSTAPQLKQHWMYSAKGEISGQPVEAFGRVFWGSWDGLEHATDLQGHEIWATYLGKIHSCLHNAGVAGTATVAPVRIGGKKTPVVFVGGGAAHFYALNASTGAIIWNTSLGSSPAYFIWDSPIVYNGSVYIGTASAADCPVVHGQLIQMSVKTGAIQHIFNVVPDGCIGGGIWGSPAIDDSTGELYVATGNPDTCSTTEVYTTAIIELHASNLVPVSFWRVPHSDWVPDSDFGSAPTLFIATIDGVTRSLVGIAHKNGIYYAFERGSLSKGPVWTQQIAKGGGCPECGGGSISPSAWDGTRLYVAGGYTTIKGVSCRGGLRALNPATGTFLWELCLSDGPVVAPVSGVPGLVVVEDGPTLVLVNANLGKTLFTFKDPNKDAVFYGASSISHGVLYVGNFDGNLYAFGL